MLPKPGVIRRFCLDGDSDSTARKLSTTTGQSPWNNDSYLIKKSNLKPKYVNLEHLRETIHAKKLKFEQGNPSLLKIYRV